MFKRQGGTASKRAQGEGEGEGKSAERHRHSSQEHTRTGRLTVHDSPCRSFTAGEEERGEGAIVVNEKVAECGTYGVYV